MPGTQQDRHPNGTIITFDEGPHTYFDDREQSYRSFTTLIHDYFPQFKADAVAERVAKREGKSVPQLLQEWAAVGADACEYGTRVHENCESRMKGLTEQNIARDDRERHTFANAVAVVDWLKSKYQFIAAEKILFSPRFCRLLTRKSSVFLTTGSCGELVFCGLRPPAKIVMLSLSEKSETEKLA